MDLEPIGRVENPEELDLDPITIPIVGYTADKKEVLQPVRFRPVQPTGAGLAVLRLTNEKGDVPVAPVMRFLDECVLTQDKKLYDDFLNDPDVFIEQTTLVEIYKALTEVYGARPTLQRPVSRNGRGSLSQTSRAAASASRSTSKASPSSSD